MRRVRRTPATSGSRSCVSTIRRRHLPRATSQAGDRGAANPSEETSNPDVRLAGAVGTDEPGDLTVRNLKMEVIENCDVTVALRQARSLNVRNAR